MNLTTLAINETATLDRELRIVTDEGAEIFFPLTAKRVDDTQFQITARVGMIEAGLSDDLSAMDMNTPMDLVVSKITANLKGRGLELVATPEDIDGYDWIVDVPLTVTIADIEDVDALMEKFEAESEINLFAGTVLDLMG